MVENECHVMCLFVQKRNAFDYANIFVQLAPCDLLACLPLYIYFSGRGRVC